MTKTSEQESLLESAQDAVTIASRRVHRQRNLGDHKDSAIYVTIKILFDVCILFQEFAFAPPTTPTVHNTTISRFVCDFFPEQPLVFLVFTIHQVIWPSPCTLLKTNPRLSHG